MDRVVPAEVFRPRQDGLAERGERQHASLVSLELVTVPFVVQLLGERSLVETADGGCGTTREPVQQRSDFPIFSNTRRSLRFM